MSVPADQLPKQPDGAFKSVREAANAVEGLLDDQGHFNPNPDQLSREHPDYDPEQDSRTSRESGQERDERGRFKAAETTEQNEDLDAATDEIEAAGDEQTEDTERSADDASAGDTDEAQTESAVDEATTEDAETDGDIHTLAQLATALEVSLDEFKAGLSHTFNANGEETTVTLAELEAGYQKDADYRRQTGKLAEDRRAAELDYQGRMQAYEQANVITAQSMGVAEQLLAAELNSPELENLRKADPAEWTARREEIGQRIGHLQQARQQAAQHYAQFQHNQRVELKTREQARLMERLPDFGSQHVQLARGTMESLGYAAPEIAEIFDHRLVLGALELAALRSEVETLRAEKSQAADTVKRVKKDVPKLQKPGKQQLKSKGRIKRDNVTRLKERARKSGSVDDAAKVIETMI